MGAGGMDWLSRDTILEGLPARKASLLLFTIESRTAQLVASDQRAAAPYLPPTVAEERERAFLAAVAAGRDLPLAPTIQAIERYAALWAPLVPDSPGIRAAVAHMLAEKYVFTQRDAPQLAAALGLADPAVTQAYMGFYGRPLGSIYASEAGLRARLRWAWSGFMDLLARVPPFWLAFFLTMPGAVGLLVMPIALANLGPVLGLVVLVSIGLLNLLTVLAFAEASTRSSTIRFGLGYIGQLAGEYLGGIGGWLATIVLALNSFVLLIVLYLNVGAALEGGTRVPAELWMIALLALILYFLWRGSYTATVSSTLLIVFVTVTMMLLIPLLTLPHVQLTNLVAAARPFADEPFTWAALGPVLGVLLSTFLGHVLVPAYAPVVLLRDPSGRAFIRGSGSAILGSLTIASIWLITVQGAVPLDVLRAAPGTVLTPLAALIGPWINVVGAVLVVLNLGLASIQIALGLYYLVLERLGPAPAGGGRITRFLLSSTPVLITFVLAEYLALNNITSFANLLGIVGALTLPVLAGALPVLCLLATRRKGDFVPAVVYRWLGHPLIAAVIYALFVGSIFLYGLLIWQDWPLRLLAVLMGILVLAATVMMLRRGLLSPRLVLGLHDDQSLHGRGAFHLAYAGEPLAAPLELRYGNAAPPVAVSGSAPLVDFAHLRALCLPLPDLPWASLKVWARRTTPELAVVNLPAVLVVAGAAEAKTYSLESAGGQVLLAPRDGPHELRLDLAPASGEELLGGTL